MPFNYTQELIDSALTYDQYRNDIKEDLEGGTSPEDDAKMRGFARKNDRLMDQYDASATIEKNLKVALADAPPTIWLMITEPWCGDAAYNLPLIAAIEKEMPNAVSLRIIHRDGNNDLMDEHLTNGSRSIPKLIILSEQLQELAVWGPRPANLQIFRDEWKNEGLTMNEIIAKTHDWYDADETDCLQTELTELVESYS